MLNKSAIVYSDSVMQLRTYLMPMDKTNITINWKEDRNILFYQSVFDNFTYQYQKIDNKMLSNRLYHVNDDVSMTNIMSDDIDDQGVFTEEEIKTANNYGYDEIGNLKFDKVEGIDKIEWTAYSKVKNITRRDGYFKVINNDKVYPINLEFLYDAMGNRIAKIEKPRDANGEKSSANWKTTYYIRDAQGNPMATYKQSSETEAASFKLIERPMYGSSRVGIDNYSLEFIGYSTSTSRIYNHVLGLKQYELSNHLGNVLTTISDKKFPVENNGLIDHYVADITSVSDYYPFGSPMDGRTFGSERYRYGFQGQEAENEISGIGNYSFYKYRISDNRLGRFFAVDPLSKEYPWNSNYAFSENRVIDGVELEGLEFYFFGNAKSAMLVGKTSINKSWEGEIVKNIYEVRDVMYELKKLPENKKPKVIFIQHHSRQDLMGVATGDESSKDISEYNMAGSEWVGTTADFTPQDVYSFIQKKPLTSEKYDAINAVSQILNALPEGGVAIFGGCLAGNEDFPVALSLLAPNRLVVMNKDFQVGFNMDKPLNPSSFTHPKYGVVGFQDGFVGAINGKKIELAGGSVNLKLNSDGKPPVSITTVKD